MTEQERETGASSAASGSELTRGAAPTADVERLARAIDGYQLPPEANRPMSYVEARRYVAAAIAKAYREDTK